VPDVSTTPPGPFDPEYGIPLTVSLSVFSSVLNGPTTETAVPTGALIVQDCESVYAFG
jgi:hypothetical protein